MMNLQLWHKLQCFSLVWSERATMTTAKRRVYEQWAHTVWRWSIHKIRMLWMIQRRLAATAVVSTRRFCFANVTAAKHQTKTRNNEKAQTNRKIDWMLFSCFMFGIECARCRILNTHDATPKKIPIYMSWSWECRFVSPWNDVNGKWKRDQCYHKIVLRYIRDLLGSAKVLRTDDERVRAPSEMETEKRNPQLELTYSMVHVYQKHRLVENTDGIEISSGQSCSILLPPPVAGNMCRIYSPRSKGILSLHSASANLMKIIIIAAG